MKSTRSKSSRVSRAVTGFRNKATIWVLDMVSNILWKALVVTFRGHVRVLAREIVKTLVISSRARWRLMLSR